MWDDREYVEVCTWCGTVVKNSSWIAQPTAYEIAVSAPPLTQLDTEIDSHGQPVDKNRYKTARSMLRHVLDNVCNTLRLPIYDAAAEIMPEANSFADPMFRYHCAISKRKNAGERHRFSLFHQCVAAEVVRLTHHMLRQDEGVVLRGLLCRMLCEISWNSVRHAARCMGYLEEIAPAVAKFEAAEWKPSRMIPSLVDTLNVPAIRWMLPESPRILPTKNVATIADHSISIQPVPLRYRGESRPAARPEDFRREIKMRIALINAVEE